MFACANSANIIYLKNGNVTIFAIIAPGVNKNNDTLRDTKIQGTYGNVTPILGSWPHWPVL